MKHVKLGTLIKVISGYPFDSTFFNDAGNGLPLIRVRDVNNGFTGLYYSGKYDDSFIINQGDLLIGLDGDFKCKVWRESKALLNQRVCKIEPIPNLIDKEYLIHFLPNALSNINKSTNYTTVKHLSTKTINQISIPLPSIAEQKLLAKNLTLAESLIAQRKESIRLLDEFLKSTFLEMFGDSNHFNKDDIIKNIGEICWYRGGGTPSKSKPEYFQGDIPWVSPKDMKSIYIHSSIDKITREAIEQSSTILIPKGSLLMVIRSGILKSKLPVSINKVDVAINQDLKAFISQEVSSEYLLYFFLSEEKNILKKVKGTTADNLSFDDIKKMRIKIPSKIQQHKFCQIVDKTEAVKSDCQKSLQELENLYSSLSQKAFKGGLRKM